MMTRILADLFDGDHKSLDQSLPSRTSVVNA